MNLVGIFCLLTGALIKATYSNRRTHESKLFQNLWNDLDPGNLVVADRGFCSFNTFAGLFTRGVDSLMRLPEKRIRKAIGSQFPNTANFDVVVTWKRPAQCHMTVTPAEFDLLPESLSVRIVRYTIAQRGFRTQSVTLVTTLLDAAIPTSELAELYFRRWSIELHFREIKIHLNMDVLRCLTPHMIERELRMHFIAYKPHSLCHAKSLTYSQHRPSTPLFQRMSRHGTPVFQCPVWSRKQTTNSFHNDR